MNWLQFPSERTFEIILIVMLVMNQFIVISKIHALQKRLELFKSWEKDQDKTIQALLVHTNVVKPPSPPSPPRKNTP
jgi:hypothetical protein